MVFKEKKLVGNFERLLVTFLASLPLAHIFRVTKIHNKTVDHVLIEAVAKAFILVKDHCIEH